MGITTIIIILSAAVLLSCGGYFAFRFAKPLKAKFARKGKKRLQPPYYVRRMAKKLAAEYDGVYLPGYNYNGRPIDFLIIGSMIFTLNWADYSGYIRIPSSTSKPWIVGDDAKPNPFEILSYAAGPATGFIGEEVDGCGLAYLPFAKGSDIHSEDLGRNFRYFTDEASFAALDKTAGLIRDKALSEKYAALLKERIGFLALAEIHCTK